MNWARILVPLTLCALLLIVGGRYTNAQAQSANTGDSSSPSEWRTSPPDFIARVRERQSAYPRVGAGQVFIDGGCASEQPNMPEFGAIEWDGTFRTTQAYPYATRHNAEIGLFIDIEGAARGLMFNIYPAPETAERWLSLPPDSRVTFSADVNFIYVLVMSVQDTTLAVPAVTLHNARLVN